MTQPNINKEVLNCLHVVKGDITSIEVDAIVNAANNSLLGGGGVDGAIHRAAGPLLLEECQRLKGCETGYAKITKGYKLPAKFIIHTVGPVWHGGKHGEAEKLASCYRECLNLAYKQDIGSIAFPAISCGVYGYPIDAAVKIAVQETIQFLNNHPMPTQIYFVCFDNFIFDSYRTEIEKWRIG